jgi:hypothetical protein
MLSTLPPPHSRLQSPTGSPRPVRTVGPVVAVGKAKTADYESAPAVHHVSMGVYTRRLQASVDG